MFTDYKFWYVNRDDNGFINECAVRFYEGEVSSKLETNFRGETKDVLGYRRIKRLKAKDLKHFKEFKKEVNGNDAVLFNSKDFGEIKTDEELKVFLNGQLARDNTRTPIDAQKV